MSLSNGEHKRREIAVLEGLFSRKNLESTYFGSRRRASGSPQQTPADPGDSGFLRVTRAASQIGCTKSRRPRGRQGRRTKTPQRWREPRIVSGQISFSWLAATSNELSLPIKTAIGLRVFASLWKSRGTTLTQPFMRRATVRFQTRKEGPTRSRRWLSICMIVLPFG